MDGWVQKSNPTIESCFQGIFGQVIGFGFGLGCSSSSSSIPEGIESRGREQQQVSPSRAEHRAEHSRTQQSREQASVPGLNASTSKLYSARSYYGTLLLTQMQWHIISLLRHISTLRRCYGKFLVCAAAIAHFYSNIAHFFSLQLLWHISTLPTMASFNSAMAHYFSAQMLWQIIPLLWHISTMLWHIFSLCSSYGTFLLYHRLLHISSLLWHISSLGRCYDTFYFLPRYLSTLLCCISVLWLVCTTSPLPCFNTALKCNCKSERCTFQMIGTF